MKKIAIFAFGALALAACNGGYNINGTTGSNLEGKTAYLVNTNTNEPVDSCIVKDSAFVFKGELAEPEVMRVQIERTSGTVLLEPQSKITIDLTTRPAVVNDNGGVNDQAAEINNALNEKGSTLEAAYRENIMKVQNGEMTVEDFEVFRNKIVNELNGAYKESIVANKDNILGAYLLAMYSKGLYNDLASLDSVMQIVKYSGKMKPIQTQHANLEKKEATKEGKMFVDFKGQNIDGGVSALSDYVGKGRYVVADFWASWCGPCRGEIPNLKAISKEYDSEKVLVLGINVWDNEQKFKEALANEHIDYPQIYVPQNGEYNATELYGIQGIPQIMLFGPDGTIIKRDLRGEGIKKAIEEAMSK